MSMIGNFMQVTPSQLQQLLDHPETVESTIYPEEGQDNGAMDIDKAWHGIHYLLTGDAWGGPEPLANVVLGGTEIGEDVGYGPARYLTPEQVKVVANALVDLPRSVLAAKFDAAAMTREELYPVIWDEGEDALDYLLTWYDSLRDYYSDAASNGNAMVKFLN